jgi:hypothetical protein
MPLIDLRCEQGHIEEHYYATHADYGCRTLICACGGTMERIMSMGAGCCYFEEGRGRWIENLGQDPIFITSPKQHREAMKKAQVQWATRGRAQPGCWV